MPLKDLIKEKIVLCSRGTSIKDVANLMKKHDVGAVLVVENEKPIGMCTDRDIVLHCVADTVLLDDKVEKVMSKTIDTVTLDQGLQDVIRLMRDHEIRRIPVVDKTGKAVGLISFGDIIGLLAKELSEISATTAVPAAA